MADYFRSLERLLDRDDRLLLPGHGPPLSDPQRLVGELLEHRREREDAITRALSEGPLSTGALVDRVYGPVGPTVKPLAERNIIAHLEKLRGERRASVSDGGRWQLT
jgi:glyoxylase-like metal-dependent hydrolase (beta-lactamase superfamily II)